MISKIEGIVLRSIDYGETSQIVTLFTRELGRITVMARGARRPKSKFGATLQPMAHIHAVVYNKETRKILPLKESSHARLRRNLSRDLEKIAVGIRIIELLRGLTQEGDPNADLFDFTSEVLDALNDANERVFNVLLFFQLGLARILGIEPDIVKEDVEAIGEYGHLILETGAVRSGPGSTGKRARRKALRTFAILVRADFQTIARMDLDSKTSREVTGLIDSYFRYHYDTAYPDRSDKVLTRLREVSSGRA